MKRGDVIRLGDLPDRARFYFLKDKKKEIWEVFAQGDQITTIVTGERVWGKLLIKKDGNLQCVFLRIAEEKKGYIPAHD